MLFKTTCSGINLSDISDDEYLTLTILYGGFEGKVVRSKGGPSFVELELFHFKSRAYTNPTLHIKVNALTPLSTLESFATEKYQILVSLLDITFDDDFIKFVYDRIKFFDVSGMRSYDQYGVELPRYRRYRTSYLIKSFLAKHLQKARTFLGDKIRLWQTSKRGYSV